MDFINKVIVGDCLDVLKDIPDQSINLIITSPPYADQRAKVYGGIMYVLRTFGTKTSFY